MSSLALSVDADATDCSSSIAPCSLVSLKPAVGGCCIYLGDLSDANTEQELQKLFSQFGAVASVEIRRHRTVSSALGYGFVTMESQADAIQAKERLSGQVLHGSLLNMGWARNNTTLFVGDLDGETTTKQLCDFFRAFGPISEADTFVHSCTRYGFVRFVSRLDAEHVKAAANRAMLGKRQIRLN